MTPPMQSLFCLFAFAFTVGNSLSPHNATEVPSPRGLTANVVIEEEGLEESLPRIYITIRTSSCAYAGTGSSYRIHVGTLNTRVQRLIHVTKPMQISAKSRDSTEEHVFELNSADVYYAKKCSNSKQAKFVGLCWPKANIIFIERERLTQYLPNVDAWKPLEIDVTVKYWNPHTHKEDVNRYVHRFNPSCSANWLDKDGMYRMGPNGVFVYMGDGEKLINLGEAYY
ncbi:hypothetical protein QR680_014395 [Steinernema hermaphroditum]|uniref:Uncharacterized protein n=1 Tax=Steinernema hermaphroditum TaxID=289476 RepID=A0AA39I8Q9_9BILA|nr:hypothetical protein QR680_014395 [Steinernema hermaphroditum]